MTGQMTKVEWDDHVRRWLEAYYPCRHGVHVFNPFDEEFGGTTVKNFPGADLTVFEELSSAGEDEDFDLMCDLHDGDDLIDSVAIRRQDLTLIERRLEAA